jgi:hypothetical protein
LPSPDLSLGVAEPDDHMDADRNLDNDIGKSDASLASSSLTLCGCLRFLVSASIVSLLQNAQVIL